MSKDTPTKPRIKSEESVLKQELRSLNKELTRLNNAVIQFEKLQAEMKDTKEQKTQLENDIREVKDQLIKVLGLE